MKRTANCCCAAPASSPAIIKDPEATAAVLRDGWLATGDIAEMDQEGYLYITGRKKELIVSSNGKKIYPARIEALLKREPLISQVLLIGDRMPYVTALFTVTCPPGEAQSMVAQAVKDVNRELAPFRADPQIQDPRSRVFHRARGTDADHESPPQPRAGKSSRAGK